MQGASRRWHLIRDVLASATVLERLVETVSCSASASLALTAERHAAESEELPSVGGEESFALPSPVRGGMSDS